MPERTYPLKQPKGWKPKVPRWTLKLPDTVTELAVAYVGLQVHSISPDSELARSQAFDAVSKWLSKDADRPLIVEKLDVVSGWDITDTTVWICYWTSVVSSAGALERLNLRGIHNSLGTAGSDSIGLWRESFTPDLSRFETNYAGTDYRPGVAKVSGSEQVSHNTTGYWGAARDRIPASAYEKLGGDTTNGEEDGDREDPVTSRIHDRSRGRYYAGDNKHTIAHIRSGQFWENCPEEEAEAYETKLEPALREGLRDIGERPLESGDFGTRFLRNAHPVGDNSTYPRKETCGAGFFRSLADMEKWAKECPSHHTIFNGAMKHKARFGAAAKFRTWHEVSVLRPGEASFEYRDCTPRTGALLFLDLEEGVVAE